MDYWKVQDLETVASPRSTTSHGSHDSRGSRGSGGSKSGSGSLSGSLNGNNLNRTAPVIGRPSRNGSPHTTNIHDRNNTIESIMRNYSVSIIYRFAIDSRLNSEKDRNFYFQT